MKRLLAVAVQDSWEGGWQSAQGNEHSVIAHPIGDGERVQLEAIDRSGVSHRFDLSSEPFPLHMMKLARYRVVKDGKRAVIRMATTVEMILSNGG